MFDTTSGAVLFYAEDTGSSLGSSNLDRITIFQWIDNNRLFVDSNRGDRFNGYGIIDTTAALPQTLTATRNMGIGGNPLNMVLGVNYDIFSAKAGSNGDGFNNAATIVRYDLSTVDYTHAYKLGNTI